MTPLSVSQISPHTPQVRSSPLNYIATPHVTPIKTPRNRIPLTRQELDRHMKTVNATTPEREVYESLHKHIKRNPDGSIHHVEKFSPLTSAGTQALRDMYKREQSDVKKMLKALFGKKAVKKRKPKK